jgi:hypothetical protein
MSEHFIGASIQPVEGTIDSAHMSSGEPGLPREFRWNDECLRIDRVLRTWRETGDCHHGSGERYVRKHWFEVVTDSGHRMKIYFQRQGRPGQKKDRWRLYTVAQADS